MRRLGIALLGILISQAAFALEHPRTIDNGHPRLAVSARTVTAAADPNDAILGYDSGPVYFFPGATDIGTLWGVRFTPTQACSLMNVQVYAYQGAGDVRFRFFRDSSGQPGAEFGAPQTRTLAGDLRLEQVSLDAVDMGASDFYVFMEILTGPPPYPVTDADGGSGRSWYRHPGQDWEHVVDYDINIRAGVRYYGEDATGPEIAHIPVSLGFSEEFSTEIRCELFDLSGIRSGKVFYRTVAASTWDSTAMVHLSDYAWSAEIPPFPAGTDVEYFIRAFDDAPSANASTYPMDAPTVVFSYRVHPGREIKYDDGSPEMFFYIDTSWSENTFAVRMTPPVYPARINLLRAFVTDTAEFDFEIHAADGDSLAGLLAGPFETRSPEPFTWADFAVPEAVAPTIASGDFFVLFKWKPYSPTLPAVGADSLIGAALRSYSYDGGFGWYKYPMFNWLIRAGAVTPAGVVDLGGAELPRDFELSQNMPNPFNPETRIEFALSSPRHVRLVVFNLLGQQVRVLVDEWLPPGRYRADFDATDDRGRAVPSGLYFYRLEAAGEHITRKMMLLR